MQNISLNSLLELFVFRLKWLILGLVCGAILLGSYTAFFVKEEYTATISMYVKAEEDQGVTTSKLHASRMLTNSCAVFLKDAEALKLAAEQMTEPAATMGQISRALSISPSEDSAVITIRAITSDAVLSQAICQAVADIAPEMLHRIVGKGTITALGDVPPAVKTGPHLVRNIVIGGAGGLLLAAVVVFILDLADTTIRRKEDLLRVTELPLLGEIPALQNN